MYVKDSIHKHMLFELLSLLSYGIHVMFTVYKATTHNYHDFSTVIIRAVDRSWEIMQYHKESPYFSLKFQVVISLNFKLIAIAKLPCCLKDTCTHTMHIMKNVCMHLVTYRVILFLFIGDPLQTSLAGHRVREFSGIVGSVSSYQLLHNTSLSVGIAITTRKSRQWTICYRYEIICSRPQNNIV